MAARSLPNAITLARLALVPAIVALTYAHRPLPLAAAALLFAVATASDWLDGYLARRLHAQSTFGTVLDPLVDKILVLCVLFVLADRGLVPLWLALLNMARELAVTAVRQARSTPARPLGANWMGKTKFCLQTGFVGLAYAHLLLQSTGRALPGGKALLFWCLAGTTALSYGFLVRFWLHSAAAGDEVPRA
ncbi:MAG: CDP-diacylglycerol--glycerol-3-phosphate 3-phosphatidyltransferase [Candidatus Brocadiaceae bacterium]|nr:CDP-diacylglycerol--glycerol-3-phosphate 3-phosphatidyltransferase [Candidatus Brocadiaceae bacterium]